MFPKSQNAIRNAVLIFGLFLLSNASAFFHIFWLSPGFVLGEFVLWIFLMMLTFWSMKHDNLFHELLGGAFKNSWTLIPFIAFSGFSILWSINWQISLYRWLILLFTLIAGGYIGLRYTLHQVIELLALFGMYVLVLSFIVVMLLPDIGVMNYYTIQGAWKGLYWHKNHLGLVATFFNLLYLIKVAGTLPNRNGAWFWIVAYLFSMLVIFQSDSVTAYMITLLLHGLVVLMLLLLKFRPGLQKMHYWGLGVLFLIVLLVLYFNIDLVFGLFGRNTSLTGRVPMWNYLFDTYLSQRPWVGYGFNAFWYVEPHRIAVQLAAGYPDPIVISDNGFIDILINTGFVGLLLFTLFYVRVCWQALLHAFAARDIQGCFPLLLMIYISLANTTWSLLFENEGFFMLVMISVFISMASLPSAHAKAPAQ